MKSRNGFVSNSSSASFVIVWEYANFSDQNSIEGILSCLLETDYYYDREIGHFNNPPEWLKEIINNTTQSENGIMKSVFFTSMLNDYSDFGEAAAILCLALVASPNAKIIGINIER